MKKLWDGDLIEGYEAYYEIVFDKVHMDDVIAMYVPESKPIRRRIPCPLHNGHDYNFSFSDTGFCCFVCGRTGGVVRFVMEMFGLDRNGAMRKLNRDFGLSLPFDHRISLREQKQINETAQGLRARRQRILDLEEEQKRKYWELWDEWIALDKLKRYLRPTSPHEPPDPNWAYAVNRITYVQYLIDSQL